MKWLAATMVAANSSCSSNGRFVGEEIPSVTNASDALPGPSGAPDSVGYGTDPDLLNPGVPWPRTMTNAQLQTSATLCDLILPEDDRSPAASTVGVVDFIDEWISAPYAQQQNDRNIIFAGLDWLEQESGSRFGRTFTALDNGQATRLLDQIAAPGDRETDKAGFFERFRYLSVGAFYTTEEGIADIAYIGNIPINGDYPGPSTEAMEHLASVLDKLGLRMPD